MLVIPYPQYYGVHGIARYVQSLVANLDCSADEVLVIAGRESSQRGGESHRNVVDIKLEPGRFGLLLWSLRTRRYLSRLARTTPAMVVNLQLPPLISILCVPRGLRVVATAHTTYLGMSGQFDDYRYFRGQWGPVSVFVKKLLERRIFRRSDKIIALTRQGRDEVLRYRTGKPVEIIPNGVDISRFTLRENAAPRYDVAFVGRIEIRKGSRPLVAVCEHLIRLRPSTRIVIVGYGDDEAYVRSALERYPENVTMLGKLPFAEVAGIYAGSRVYASTSFYEGLPGTCLEAMAMGSPAIVWDLPFYADLVVSGETGLTVPVGDVAQFARSVSNLLDDPEAVAAMGRQAHELVNRDYDWSRVAPRLLAAVTGVVPNR